MSAHTPGPWSVAVATSSRPTMHINGPRGVIASVFSRRHEADANVIKAAPAMLAALRSIVALDEKSIPTSPSWRAERDVAINAARVAIDIAEGK